ncbi:hypothetical protein [Lederbergia galactosidilytica]|uniref:Uncharacterized protein n=1 Tax=Lederbergia galactosidilytica TaxID=217031 RepID=A0A0Q9Y831_9BACI|nr:hypothetical protein [Lederbergia galactosidilytica]KRG14737.1 hypothetical protein ACA30_09800 [Virgibacillus soli]KRG16992.1 hypothetical protein ACA29_01665 [Lederbergia galactosidilytica]OAK70752.1 hypothetical protein ABB05_11600 [Lederbergia galactosidilytica]
MEIDLSPLQGTMNEMAINLVKVLGIPFIVAMFIGLLLERVKVPKKIVSFICIVILLTGCYQMIIRID